MHNREQLDDREISMNKMTINCIDIASITYRDCLFVWAAKL